MKVLAIKESWRLCQPDAIYGCDRAWWHANLCLPDYCGIKIAYDPLLPQLSRRYGDVHLIRIAMHDDEPIFEPGLVGSGGNSAFQAVNLAVQFGARLVCLVGIDMHNRSGLHWYGRNE